MLAVSFRANQILSGLALFIFASGVARFIGEPHGFTVINKTVTAIEIPVLSEVPVLGPILFRQTIFVYISWVLVAFAAFHTSRTRLGLSLRAVGEEPSTADTAFIGWVCSSMPPMTPATRSTATWTPYPRWRQTCAPGRGRRVGDRPRTFSSVYEDRVDDNHQHLICSDCGCMVDVDCAAGDRPCLEDADSASHRRGRGHLLG